MRLEEALADTPVVLVHGPRQCGKTTPARMKVLYEIGYIHPDLIADHVGDFLRLRTDPHECKAPGAYPALVKVIDIFGIVTVYEPDSGRGIDFRRRMAP